MKFVIYSNAFAPQSGAESFCSTRFAGALAYAGHEVHVVTMDWPQGIAKATQDFLQNPRLDITRLPIKRGKLRFLWARIRYFASEIVACDIAASIRAVNRLLEENPDAILVTRSMPFSSMIVGWHCRKRARKWIAHFCDPLTLLARDTFWAKLRYRSMRFWLNRTIRDADAISLTCEQVKRYYHDEHGEVFDRARCIVADHVGEPPLPYSATVDRREFPGKLLVHTGSLSVPRSSLTICEAVTALNASGVAVTFAQAGCEDRETQAAIAKCGNARILKSTEPDFATALTNAADAVVVTDQETSLGYIPFIPSKFAYQLFVNRPMVIVSHAGSEMWRCCRDYPRAGLFFAEIGNVEQVKAAIAAALACDPKSIDRAEICHRFSRAGVAGHFAAEVAGLPWERK